MATKTFETTILLNTDDSTSPPTYVLKVYWGDGTPTVLPTGIRVNWSLGIPANLLFLVGGNFDGGVDPYSDLLLLAGGIFTYWDGSSGTIIPHTTPVDWLLNTDGTPKNNYVAARSADFNSDGNDDVEMTDEDGEIDTYYGSPAGLTSGAFMTGVPSADGNDGQFLSLVGGDLLTVKDLAFEASVFPYEGSTEAIRVEVFDGDVGGLYDNVIAGLRPDGDTPLPGVACYMVKSCTDYGMCETLPGFPKSSNDFAEGDGAWKELFHDGSPPPYRYRVQVMLGACDGAECLAPCHPTTGRPVRQVGVYSSHAFKLRANGRVGDDATDWSFIGMDSVGEFAPEHQPAAPIPDTAFDGSFVFPFEVGDHPETVTVIDCDADFTRDGELDQFDPHPTSAVAMGANDTIKFAISWYNPQAQPPGFKTLPFQEQVSATAWEPSVEDSSFLYYRDPSGGYDFMSSAESCDQHTIYAKDKPGRWGWTWRGVGAVNNIHVLRITASNVPFSQPVWFFYDRFHGSIPFPTSAQTLDVWRDSLTKAASLLPLTLGTELTIADEALLGLLMVDGGVAALPGNGSMTSWANALRHGKRTICHNSPGNSRGAQAITISASTVPTHLAHGDDLSAPQAMGELIVQLLVAELNIAAAAQVGEDLSSGILYGRSETVAEILAEAGALVDGVAEVCTLDAASIDRIRWLSLRLDSINAGEVLHASQVSPPEPQVPMSLPSLRSAPMQQTGL